MVRGQYIWRCTARQVLIAGVAAGVAMLVAATLLGTPSSARQSHLEQQVGAPVCPQPEGCDMDPPIIDKVKENEGRPIIKGHYDAVYTKILRVIFGGRVYTLGVDGQLTVQNGQWRLDLSGISPPLTDGDYELIVETVGYDDEIRRVTTIVTIANAGPVDPEEPGENTQPGTGDGGRPVPLAPNTGVGIRSVVDWPALLSLVLIACTIVLMAWRRLQRSGDDV